MPIHNILDHGAVGDGQTLATGAIQAAIDACAAAGGGTVCIPAGGAFVSGTITLRSHVHLCLEPGARLLGSPDQADYPNPDLHCLIEARDCQHIAITGFGAIDGQALLHMEEDLGYIHRGRLWRPRLVGLLRCRHVTMRDITVRNSASWGLHLTGCEDVVIHGVRILNDLKVPNCDGIDPDHCRNVRISDCHIEAGDDCIVIKNTPAFAECGPSENITVTNCTLVSTSAAIKIGTESVCDFRRLVFQNCTISGSNRGLSIQLRDQGNVEDVLFANMVVETRLFDPRWWGCAEPIHVSAHPRNSTEPPPWNPEGAIGQVRRVRFHNILCRGENGIFIAGCPQSPVEDIALEHVRIEVGKWSKWPGGIHDRRPCHGLSIDETRNDPAANPGLTQHPTAGVFVEHARDITLRHVDVRWGTNRPAYFGSALEARHVAGLTLDGLTGEAAHPDRDPAHRLEDVR